MATSNVSEVQIINMALRALAEEPIVALTDATRRAQLANEHWPTTRDAVLEEHPWRFARVRATLYAYREPVANVTPGAGATVEGTTGVTFTASQSVFVAGDVGKTLRGTTEGMATITTYVSGTVVQGTITGAFAGGLLATTEWRIYSPTPAWGYAYSIDRPADCLRIWRKSKEEPRYEVEGDRILADQDSLAVVYTRQETDTTKYPPTYVQALVARLAATFAENITGQGEKVKMWMQVYDIRLRLAKARDGQEGTPQSISKHELIDVRYGDASDLGWGRSR